MTKIDPPTAPTSNSICEGTQAFYIKLFDFLYQVPIFLFFPTLIFFRGLNARCIEICFIGWLGILFIKYARRSLSVNQAILGGLLGISFLLSSTFSIDPPASIRGSFFLLHGFIFYFLLQNAPDDQKFWDRLAWSILLTIMAVWIDALTQWFFQKGIITELVEDSDKAGFSQVSGPFSNTNDLVVTICFLPAFFLFLLQRTKTKYSLIRSAIFVIGFLLAIGTVMVSDSRNLWVTLFFAGLLFGWLKFRWKGIILITVILALGFTLAPRQKGRHILTRFQSAILEPHRIGLWNTGLEIWKESPILGIGPEMFWRIWPQYKDRAHELGFKQSNAPEHLHNIFIETLVERGIAGLLAFLSLSGYALWLAYKNLKDPATKNISIFLGSTLFLLLLCGLFDFSFRYRWYAYSLFFVSGLSFSLGKVKENFYKEH